MIFSLLTQKTTHGAVHDLSGKLENVVRDSFTDKKLRDLVAEVVAVVSEQVVGLGGVTRSDLLQVHLEHVFRNVCLTHLYGS